MKIGIPRALLNFEYPVLITEFLKNLDVKIVFSDNTNQKIINDGLKYSIDESCLASKIFMGHVEDLIEKSKKENIDYILIPRIGFFGKRETVCVKFYALYDICKNIFDFRFLCLDIDLKNNKSELIAFVNLGKKLGKNNISSIKAYFKAKKKQILYDKKMYFKQIELISNSKKNILVVSHSYIINDRYLGENIKKYLNDNDINVILSDINLSKINSIERKKFKYKDISKSIYWKYNINLRTKESDMRASRRVQKPEMRKEADEREALTGRTAGRP